MKLKKEFYNLIHEDEDILDFVLEYALDGLWYCNDQNHNIVLIDPKLWNVLGYSSKHNFDHTQSWKDLILQEDLELINEYLVQRKRKSDPVFDKIIRYKHRDGSNIFMRCRIQIVKDKNKEPIGIIAAHKKLKEKKSKDQNEQELLEAKEKAKLNEKRYRTLFENMNTGFVLFEVVQDEKGAPIDLVILAANKRFEETKGLNLRDSIGQRLTDVLPGIEKDEADWIGTYSKVALTGQSIHYEQGSELLGYYYSISAFPAAPKQCAVTFLDITERKLAEKKLRESEYRFRKIYEDGANGMVMVGIDSKFFKANSTFCQMTGYTEEELQHKTFLEITHPEDRGEDVVHINKMKSGEIDLYKTEKRYLKKNGGFFWVQLTASPIFDSDGQLLHFFGIITNITERKQAEMLLAESEERFRLATEHAKVAVWEYDFNTNFMSRSRNHDKLYGLDWQKIWNLDTFLDSTHPEDREYSNEQIMNALNSGGPDNYSFEFRVIHPDDSVHWLMANGKVIQRDQTGRGVKVRGTLTDITERKKVELDLLETSRLLQSSQEIARLGSFVFNAADGSTIWSEEEYKIYGLSPGSPSPQVEEMIEKYIHPDDIELLRRSLATTIQNHEIYELEHRIIRPNGTVRWVYNKAHPQYDEFGNYTGYIGATLDITERKQLQEELEKFNAELEAKVKERTALLEASNKELEAFSYSVSHDLRAPLRHINGYVDLLVQRHYEDLPDKARHYLTTISSASSQMGTLIDDLLQYSRTGRMEVKKTDVELNSMIKEIREALEPPEKERNIEWKIQELPTVFGDPALLKLVWTNLLDNAIKYTLNQEIAKIEITCRKQEESFVFSVCDNGVGFDMKYAQKLFGVFQRLHSQSEFEGTGIGLANVQRIVHKHYGQVWAEAELNKGATFYFTLPKGLKRND